MNISITFQPMVANSARAAPCSSLLLVAASSGGSAEVGCTLIGVDALFEPGATIPASSMTNYHDLDCGFHPSAARAVLTSTCMEATWGADGDGSLVWSIRGPRTA
jgi:hypothetical protein